ncbi:MAG TPA: 5-formyltetrahydrofolate cyclo-ligase [Cyclobacteriaceae bacterium]|nr:5-formyltetrahydrofolate cyclo-ligase [Cyclobacteriaceae bacterium]
MTKQEIRKKYVGLREALSSAEIDKSSREIANRFFSSIDFSSISVIHSFLPISSKKEINTWLIIDEVMESHPDVKIAIPKIEGDRLVNFYFKERSQLAENPWKILEPVSGEKAPTQKIDLVIVPLLAFDRTGNRVGYGKGFYDKFLAECRSGCKKIGLSFFDPVDESIPVDAFDMRLDLVITPTEIYRFEF